MDRGAWWSTVYGVTKSWTWLKWLSTHTHNPFINLGRYVFWNSSIWLHAIIMNLFFIFHSHTMILSAALRLLSLDLSPIANYSVMNLLICVLVNLCIGFFRAYIIKKNLSSSTGTYLLKNYKLFFKMVLLMYTFINQYSFKIICLKLGIITSYCLPVMMSVNSYPLCGFSLHFFWW